MEDRLLKLIAANQPENRYRWAKDYKNAGKHVIGVMTSQVPEELIHAAGMLPIRITGTWLPNVPKAVSYRSESTCSYCNHVFESILNGELNFLDGIIATDKDQDIIRLFDAVLTVKKYPLLEVLHAPMIKREAGVKFYVDEIKRFKSLLENLSGKTITDEAIFEAINIFNNMRRLVLELYELQKAEHPPLLGNELLGITTAAQVMPRDEFVRELNALMPYIRQRKAPAKCLKPRIMVVSDSLDQPEYLKLIEETALVVMDDMDTGRRYFMNPISYNGDWVNALAVHYVMKHSSPRMQDWDDQIRQILDWTKEYNINGVIGMPLTWCYPQRFRWPLISRALDEASVPNIALEREYHFENEGQLRTRVGAFSEMFTID